MENAFIQGALDQAGRKRLSFLFLSAVFFLFLVVFLKERRGVFSVVLWMSFVLLPPTLCSFCLRLLVFGIGRCYFRRWPEEMTWKYSGAFLPMQSFKDFVVILIYGSRTLCINMSVLHLLISFSLFKTVISSKLAKTLLHWVSQSSMKME